MGKGLRQLLCAVLIATPTSLAAQQVEPSPVADALLRARWTAPSFGPAGDFPPGDDQEPRRHTRRGAIIGGVAGAVTGLGIGTFIALFCQLESRDPCVGWIPGMTLLGAAGGTVAGAIIGAAIPREPAPATEPEQPEAERPEPERPEPEQQRPEQPRPEPVAPGPGATSRWQVIGTGSAQVVGASGRVDEPGSAAGPSRRTATGAGVRVNLYAELKPWLAIGPELGQTWFGDDFGAIRYVTAALRGTWRTSRVSPYAIADLGLYQWTGGSREYLGGGLGAGIRFTPHAGSDLFLDLGARWQQNAQNIEHVGAGSIGLGAGVVW